MTVHKAGSDQDKLYTDAKNAYGTAKTAWDNYVAILEKNAKTDAFAALFSPPKAPTVPPLPSLPWVPATYTGYVRATAAELNLYNKSSTTKVYAVGSQRPRRHPDPAGSIKDIFGRWDGYGIGSVVAQ